MTAMPSFSVDISWGFGKYNGRASYWFVKLAKVFSGLAYFQRLPKSLELRDIVKLKILINFRAAYMRPIHACDTELGFGRLLYSRVSALTDAFSLLRILEHG